MSVADSHDTAYFTVPERHATALSVFASLPSETQANVYRAAESIPTSTSPWDAARNAIKGPLGSKVDPKVLIAAIRGLFYVRQLMSDRTDDEFVKATIEGIKSSATDGETADSKKLKAAIVNLLALKNLEISHHASRVRFDHANHMHDASIVTDLRPIFDKDGSQVQGAVISHTLKIDFAGSSEEGDEFYLAVDSDDLDKLEAVVQRARRKELALKAFSSKANLKVVEDLP